MRRWEQGASSWCSTHRRTCWSVAASAVPARGGTHSWAGSHLPLTVPHVYVQTAWQQSTLPGLYSDTDIGSIQAPPCPTHSGANSPDRQTSLHPAHVRAHPHTHCPTHPQSHPPPPSHTHTPSSHTHRHTHTPPSHTHHHTHTPFSTYTPSHTHPPSSTPSAQGSPHVDMPRSIRARKT